MADKGKGDHRLDADAGRMSEIRYAPSGGMNRRECLSAIERIFLWSQRIGRNIKSINLFPIDRRASGHWQILLGLLLGAICQSCAPTDVHIREKPAISAAAGIIRPTGALASEFLEAAKLESANVAANRTAREHYPQGGA